MNSPDPEKPNHLPHARDQRLAFQRIVSGEQRGLSATLARIGLAALEPAYLAAITLRNTAYDRGWKRAHPLGRPTISVGNLTTGGAGKTPMVIWLAKRLAHLNPAVLMRGYRLAGATFSDEAEMIQAAVPECAVMPDPDRVAAAARVLQERPETGVFLLDDGFQHRRAHRDVNIALVHAGEPFGYEHVLPRGLLREPMRSLRRADLIVITHSNEISPNALERLRQPLTRYSEGKPIFAARHELTGVTVDGAHQDLTWLANQRFIAFAGLASPRSFEAAAHKLGDCARFIAYQDHHPYTQTDVDDLSTQAKDADARLLLTTAKDAVKLQQLTMPMPLGVLQLDIQIENDEAMMTEIHRQV